MPTPEQLIEWQREWSTAWDTADADAVAARFAEDTVLLDYGVPDPIVGPDQARAHAAEYFAQSPMSFKEIAIATDGDTVFQEWTAAGTVPGPDGDIREFKVRGATTSRFDDNGIRGDMFTYWDVLGYLRSAGAITAEMDSAIRSA